VLVLNTSSENFTRSRWGTHVGSYIPLIILNTSIISPRYRLYFIVGKFRTCMLFYCTVCTGSHSSSLHYFLTISTVAYVILSYTYGSRYAGSNFQFCTSNGGIRDGDGVWTVKGPGRVNCQRACISYGHPWIFSCSAFINDKSTCTFCSAELAPQIHKDGHNQCDK